jgi:hypothetical protein
LSSGFCSGISTASPTCRFEAPGTLNVTVTATDTSGETSSPSPALAFQVTNTPEVGSVAADRPTVDVNQVIGFVATGTGGFGPLTYVWTGLPSSSCTGIDTSYVACVVESAGPIGVSATAEDAVGGNSSPSPPVFVEGYPDPVVSVPALSLSTVPAGELVMIDTTEDGGYSPYTYAWTGLPTGCTTLGGDAVCYPNEAGTYRVTLSITDADNYTTTSAVSTLIVTAGATGPPGSWMGGAPRTELWEATLGGATAIVGAVAILAMWASRRKRRR